MELQPRFTAAMYNLAGAHKAVASELLGQAAAAAAADGKKGKSKSKKKQKQKQKKKQKKKGKGKGEHEDEHEGAGAGADDEEATLRARAAHNTGEAGRLFDAVVALEPQHWAAHMGRGVLHARADQVRVTSRITSADQVRCVPARLLFCCCSDSNGVLHALHRGAGERHSNYTITLTALHALHRGAAGGGGSLLPPGAARGEKRQGGPQFSCTEGGGGLATSCFHCCHCHGAMRVAHWRSSRL